MKVCIIGHTERNYLPYIEKYTKFFDENSVDYDVVCWQREERPENNTPNEYNFFEEAKEGAINKIRSYLNFKKYVLEILEKNKYDKVVILTTVPAIFLRKYLHTHFKNRYLFDFRDYSFEKFLPYKMIVDKIIDDSQITTISSHGFMDFLSKNKKIVMNHNIPVGIEKAEPTDMKQKSVINIGFVGGVRYYEENCALIRKLKNEFRYQLWYIGKPVSDCDLQSYCQENEITNVSFIGKYINSQKIELYKNMEMINSIYGDSSLEVTTALPNRLYEGCLLKKPIISSKGTFLGEVIERYHLGLAIDVDEDDVLKVINEYVDNFDMNLFNSGCEEFLADVKNDEDALLGHLRQFIKDKKPTKGKKNSNKSKTKGGIRC
ncbi:MAG: hypothetical protein RR444_04450 [Oscillospiraceae bacterium]